MRAGRNAAPAVVPRKHDPGRPRVAVRPNYVGPPFSGLDAGRMNGGESCRDQGERNAPRPSPEARPRVRKVAAMERRAARALRHWAPRPKGANQDVAPLGAPSPHPCGALPKNPILHKKW